MQRFYSLHIFVKTLVLNRSFVEVIAQKKIVKAVNNKKMSKVLKFNYALSFKTRPKFVFVREGQDAVGEPML